MSSNLSIIEKLYTVYKSIVVLNIKLDKKYRYGLGIDTEKTILQLFELVIMASHAPKNHKSAYLIKSQAQLDILRLKLRLYLELGLANETKIFQVQSDLEEVGRMLGGWKKSL